MFRLWQSQTFSFISRVLKNPLKKGNCKHHCFVFLISNLNQSNTSLQKSKKHMIDKEENKRKKHTIGFRHFLNYFI